MASAIEDFLDGGGASFEHTVGKLWPVAFQPIETIHLCEAIALFSSTRTSCPSMKQSNIQTHSEIRVWKLRPAIAAMKAATSPDQQDRKHLSSCAPKQFPTSHGQDRHMNPSHESAAHEPAQLLQLCSKGCALIYSTHSQKRATRSF
mmetsp:Transcript_40405/g.63075  ORF Transcript_40405/g.63075 Transcript_40405/m.63075 type:complete len:147 (-) Transcript_40405:328-768(-)